MAANTGPDVNTYSIPEVALGDTFNTWRDITNTSIYKLNKIKTYDGFSSSSIDLTLSSGGTFTTELATNVNKGVTFMLPVNFQSGVTFNGAVTFNASTFTVNANVVTIDDYNIVLGDTTGASDAGITAAGGGGLLLKRGTSGQTAEWLWQTTQVHGITGVWRSNTHIGFSGATSGLYPHSGGVLPVHGSGIRIDGGSTSDHGLLVSLSNDGGAAGTTGNRSISFSRYAPSGSTAFMTVLSGTTYGAYPSVSIPSGVNKKTIRQTAHGFSFGSPVRLLASGYTLASAADTDSAEVLGVVSNVLSSSEFEIAFIGEIYGDFSNVLISGIGTTLGVGSVYYLSPTQTGKYNSAPSTIAGSVHKAVFVGTGASSGVVLPHTGGVLSDAVLLSDSSSLTTPISQYNTFKIGDVIRFRAGSTTLSYTYTSPSAGTVSNTYTNGIYVLAQANTKEEAEVAGIVIRTEPYIVNSVDTGINYRMYILMDGFFDLSSVSGVCAMNGAVAGNITPGTVYYLNSTTVGTTGSLENASKYCLTSVEPTTIGHVRKPILCATSSYSGYAFSYRGDVYNGEQSAFTGYTGSSAYYVDYPVGSIVMGQTSAAGLSLNCGFTLFGGSGGADYYLNYQGPGNSGTTMSGVWLNRGRVYNATGPIYYHLCQRVS